MPEMLEVECYRLAADEVVGRKIASVRAPDDWFTKGETTPGLLAAVLPGRVVTRTASTPHPGRLQITGVTATPRAQEGDRLPHDPMQPIEFVDRQ